jgi:glucose/arabinose dehydrogenase/PKD repeat protein
LNRCIGLLACVVALLLGVPAPAGAATVPPNFEDRFLAATGFPTGLAFTPDGRLLIATKDGALRIYENGVLRPTPAINLGPQLCNDIERGLSGVTVGPDFSDSGHVFLYYTYDKGTDTCGTDPANPSATPVNRVSRFMLGDDNAIDPASETVLVDNIPSPTGNHIAGDLHFGKDGNLYVTVGDGGCDYTQASACGPWNNAARYPHALVGKVLRITSDGSVPPDNPYTGPGTARCNETGRTTSGLWCQEIFATGLRNPFRFAFDESADSTRFFINDVGQDHWEEIDQGQAGADYGWNLREGPCVVRSTTDCGPPPTGLTNPVFAYDHSGGCTSVTAGAFVPQGVWPAEYEGSYLFADFVCSKMFRLEMNDSGGSTATEIATELGNPIAMTFGPPGFNNQLYYLSLANPVGLHSISFTGGANRRPNAVAHAAPTNGSLPLDVQFDGSESTDPDGDTITYEWDFGDGSPRGSGPTTTHRYQTAGTYTATLEVADPAGATDMQEIRIDAGNLPPAPSIDGPSADKRFAVRESISLSGSATDPEDGTLADSALTWEVVKHHASHTHPFLPPTTGSEASITAPFPEDFASTTNSYLEIRLTATDSRGLSATVTQDLQPALVDLALATNPTGLQLEVNGTTAPASLTSWQGWDLELNAPHPQWDATSTGQTFRSWSDGGAQRHTITTPASDTTYTALFTTGYARPAGAGPLRVSLVPAYRPCESPGATHGPPLDEPSCRPPVQASDYTTVGTPDANGFPARSTGRARFQVLRGDPATSANEADVRITISITDVLDRTTGANYVGSVRGVVALRITDRQSSLPASTLSDLPLAVDMPCTPDLAVAGSTCSAVTTMNALTPGSVLEGARSIWELGPVQVFDGGPDGDPATPGNGLLATQGVFVP